MEQYEQWHQFWNNYLHDRHGKEKVESESDLFLQVARTVNRQPVSKEIFDAIIDQIKTDLELNKDDILVDFCCGNGLFTYELKDNVNRIIGIEFAKNIIDVANEFKAADNINYCLGSVLDYMKSFNENWPGIIPTKYLMNDSLAYFSLRDLETILIDILSVSKQFIFLARGVPNENLKWNYYNTPERKQHYESLVEKGDLSNDGLGSWWEPDKIFEICKNVGLNCIIRNQEMPVSNYRMDIIISKA